MGRFAKIDEEVFLRYSELTGEEFRLYCTIVFHTFFDTGICRKNLRQLSLIHGLDYICTTRRFKKLLKLEWCAKTKQGIRPLIGLNVVKTTTSENVVKNTTFGDEMLSKTQHAYKECIEPFKDQNFLDSAAAENSAAEAAETNGHLSKFSRQECLRYAELCRSRGEDIKSTHALANHAYRTGEMDAFISASLYPEQIEIEQQIEYDDDYQMPEAEPLTDEEKQSSLILLRSMLRDAPLEDLESFSVNYTSDDWEWLKKELKNSR